MLSTTLQFTPISTLPRILQQPGQSDNLPTELPTKLDTYINTIAGLICKHAEILSHETTNEEVITSFKKLADGLKLMQLHFAFVLNVLGAKSQDEVAKIKLELKCIACAYDKLKESSDVSLVATNGILETAVKDIFSELNKVVDDAFASTDGKTKEQKEQKTIDHLKIITAKLEAIIEYLPGIVMTGRDDVFNYAKDSAIWRKMYRNVDFIQIGERKALDESVQRCCQLMKMAHAVLYTAQQSEDKTDNKMLGKIVGTISGLYYTMQDDQAHRRMSLLYADPKMDWAFSIWNLPDRKIVRNIFKLRLPPIDYDRKIYVPRLFPAITRESLLEEYKNNTLNTINENYKMEVPDLSGQREEVLKTLFVKNSERVTVRIMAPWPFVLKGEPMERAKTVVADIKKKLQAIDTRKSKYKESFNGVIIHIHGGGFVSMSSSSHRNYLYRWAKSLNMMIFSIDYRLAPKDPYPAGFDDVWQAYNWIINYSNSILGIPLDRIVMAGDSAGGNLAMVLTLRAIKEGVRVPDGCLLSYAALNLHPQKAVPSYFQAIDDTFLSYNMLKLCLKAYIPEEFNPETDPFLSPIVASEEMLKKVPAIRIVTGTNDPLHDDNWKLMKILQDLGKDVRMTVYEGLTHGFLGLDELAGYEMLIAETVGRIRELFYSVEKK